MAANGFPKIGKCARNIGRFDIVVAFGKEEFL
jgi:hypothetical protein